MFDLENAVRKWKKGLRKYEEFEDGWVADLELHLRDAYAALISEGWKEEDAFRAAAARVGSAENIATEFRKNRRAALDRRSPLRPTRFMPALAGNYIKTALRGMRRRKLHSFINVLGLAAGLAVCLLIALWVVDELSFDRFHSRADRIFRFYWDESATRAGDTSVLTPPPLAGALKKDFPEVIRATRFGTWHMRLVSIGDKSFNENRYWHVDPDFFSMFSFPLLRGDPETVFSAPNSVVLSEATAARYFGDEDPIGKVLNVNHSFDVTVTGVIRNGSPHSSLEFELLSPFELLLTEFIGEDNRDNWGFNSFGTYIQLAPKTSGVELEKKLEGTIREYNPDDTDIPRLQPLTAIHLYSRLGHDSGNRGDIQTVWIFAVLAVFVLLMAGVNFMNLSTARSAGRAREVGLRKVVGAGRSQLIRQFFGESVFMAFLALIFALVLAELARPLFNTLSGKQIPPVWRASPAFLLGFLGITLMTGLFSGSYPALFLSSFRPVRVLRGSRDSKGASPLFRKALVVFQFCLTVFLILGTLVISRQLTYMRHKDLGFNRDFILYSSIHGELLEKYRSIRERFLRNPNVLHVTASMSWPFNIQGSPGTPEWEGKPPDEVMEIKADFIDYDYIETFEIPLIEGRGFSPDHATDPESAFIVNQEAVRRMGLGTPAVGKRFGFWNIDGRIIGVMKDAHFQNLYHKIEPLVFKMNPGWLRRMYIKIRSGDLPAILSSLEGTWNEMNLGYPFEYRFLDEDFLNSYRSEARLESIFQVFTILAVLIACLGLFGLAAFMAEQRTREIGIRKVLGASTAGITLKMSAQFAAWVLAANLIAAPLAWFFARRWLQGFAYRTGIAGWIFLFVAGASLGMALLTVALQCFRAARANPVESLRREA